MAQRISFALRFFRITLIVLILALASGFLYSEQTKRDLTKEMSQLMNISLAAINPDRIEHQSATISDTNAPDYIRLKDQFLRLGKIFSQSGVDSVYAMVKKDNKVLFLVDSVTTTHPRYSAPGIEYKEPPKELNDVFENGKMVTVGPYTDEYGTFYTHLSPLRIFSDNRIVGALGLDMDVSYYNGRILSGWFYIGRIFLIIYIFALMVVYFWDRREKAQEQIHESRERYAATFQSSKDAIMTLTPPDWRFSDPNPATIKLFGAKGNFDFAKYSPWQLSPEKQPDGQSSTVKSKKMIDLAMKKGSNFFEWTHQRIDGTVFEAEILLTRFELNGTNVLQANVRDVSERKLREEELARQKKELEELNELMVGREIKMIELKEELQKIKNQNLKN